MDGVSPELLAYYQRGDEAARLAQGRGRLELARTQQVVRRHLPSGALHILDVGGGPGAHAAWLADDGHTVHLVDPVPDHVATAASLATGDRGITAAVGDARHLPAADASYDAVLVLGPLYHLTERADRITAMEEARRVVRPGGAIFVAAISRFAALFDGLSRRFLLDPAFRAVVDGDLRTGQHRNPAERPGFFATSYFHHPDELAAEAAGAGLAVGEVVGLEGLGAWLTGVTDDWDDQAVREMLMFAAGAVEREPTLLGLSGHLLLVARRDR